MIQKRIAIKSRTIIKTYVLVLFGGIILFLLCRQIKFVFFVEQNNGVVNDAAVVLSRSIIPNNSNNNSQIIMQYSSLHHESQIVIPDVIQFYNNINVTMSDECVHKQDNVNAICTEFFHVKKKWCQKHEREIPRTTIRRKIHNLQLKRKSDSSSSSTSECRTLWFAGFHEGELSRCNNAGYRYDYATALSSWKLHAANTLQPVLLLGRLGLNATEDISALRQWAIEKGAIVVTIDKLSFQDNINNIWQHETETLLLDHAMGPYMRLDIPAIIEQHNLFNLSGICQRYVLYTDADILFINPISYQDIQDLILEMSIPTINNGINVKKYRRDKNAYIMYGREFKMNYPKPTNTGVIVMNVPRFQQEFPNIIKFRNEHKTQPKEKFYAFDQGWLNLYFQYNKGVTFLPLYWNWKLYWKLEPSLLSDIKIVHFHGPKPITLQKIRNCVLGETINETELIYIHNAYMGMVLDSICCDDSAKTTSIVLQLYDLLKPSYDDVC